MAMGVGGKDLFRNQGVRKVRREREKGGPILEFRGPLWDDRTADLEVVLEALAKASHEDLEHFEEEWVNPLRAEGLHLNRIFDLLLCGTARPN
jgi:hypothetical protein